MGIHLKLFAIQQALKAPKDQLNKFGGYSYRSCEGILEALKPHLGLNKCIVTMLDHVQEIGGSNYVVATATITDTETGEMFSCTAYAREEESKKGMDSSQITGSASSYARKYALNGLFAIDDNKDSDATNDGDKNEETVRRNYIPYGEASNDDGAYKKPPEDNKFRCEDCGAVLKPYKHNGKDVPIRQHADLSVKKYGKILCMDCINQMKGETNA